MSRGGQRRGGGGRGAGRGGCLLRLMVVLVVLGAAAALAWMLFLPVVVADQIRARTGFAVSVASLSCNAFTGKLAVRGLVVRNPASFPVSDFVELREFSGEADVWSLFSDRFVVEHLTVDVRRVTLVRRADGRSNAEVFRQNLSGPPGAAATPPAPGASAPPARQFLIRRLALRFDQLVVADHTRTKPVVEEFPLGLDQHYANLTDAKQLLVPEVLRRLAAANLPPALGGWVPGDFGRALGVAVEGASARGTELLKDAGQTATDLFKGLREKLEESRKP